MEAKGLQAKSMAELRSKLEALRAGDFQPTLAFVFASVAHDVAATAAVFAEAGVDVFGATSATGILASGDDHCIHEEAVVALLLDLDRAAYRLHLFDSPDADAAAAGREVGRWARETFARPALMVTAPGLATDGDALVAGIVREIGADAPLFGGLAGDDMRFSGPCVFTGDAVSTRGVLALCLDGARVRVDGVAASGWEGVGAEKTITRAEGNVVHTIDGVPALDLYKDYLGVTLDGDLMVGEYPLQIVKDGYSVLRSALVSDPESRALVFGGTIPEGAVVRFSASPGMRIVDEALAEMERLRERVDEADALVLFSCKARHMALGPMAEDEVAPIQRLWQRPLAGFYTYGEIGRNGAGHCDFHNETCVLVTLKAE